MSDLLNMLSDARRLDLSLADEAVFVFLLHFDLLVIRGCEVDSSRVALCDSSHFRRTAWNWETPGDLSMAMAETKTKEKKNTQ